MKLNSINEEEKDILMDLGTSIYMAINIPMSIIKNEDYFEAIWFKMFNYLLDSKEKIIINKQPNFSGKIKMKTDSIITYFFVVVVGLLN